MPSSAPVTTILKHNTSSSSSSTTPTDPTSIKELHSIPCKTTYTGPAPVYAYFLRERVSGDDVSDAVVLERSALRGRRLEGRLLTMPEGFSVNVLAEKTGGRLEVESSRAPFTLWEHDREPSERSVLARALAYLPVAAALAAPSATA